MKKFVKTLVSVGVASAFSFAMAPANAAAVLLICNDAACDLTGDVFVSDNSPGDLTNVSGAILWTGSYEGIELGVATGSSKPFTGSDAAPKLTLNVYAANPSGGLATVWFYYADTDYTALGHAGLSLSADPGPNDTTTNVTASFYGGSSNTKAPLDLSSLLATLSVSGNADGTASALPFSPTSLPGYALTLGLRVEVAPGGSVNTGATAVIPEPAGLALLGVGLLALGATYRRRVSAKKS